jgi:carbamate kinase
MGIYKFYENWSIETFGNRGLKKRAVCPTPKERIDKEIVKPLWRAISQNIFLIF